ncbi:MAG TPA: hemolysin III family protein [Alphaproteobacteria bacterium]|nr:hemolysin III family protein [Alphaproteobacteria bacterium]
MTGPLRDCRSREQAFDRWLHWIAIAAAPVAVFALLWNARHGNPQVLTGLIAYGIGLLAMIGCSALYHLCGASRHKPLFRRFDHAAIFLLIAGTYTPFAVNGLLGSRGIVLLAWVWTLAMLGVAMKFLRPGMLERTSIALYLLLGWSVLAVLDALMLAVSPGALALLAAGGILYTIGVVFHLWESLPYQNAIWHGFVLAGAACHYAAIVHEIG